MQSGNLANERLEFYEERYNSFTEARLDEDVRATSELRGIICRLRRLIIDTPPDHIDSQVPRDASEHCSSRLIQGTEQVHFDANKPPSTVMAITELNFEDDQMLLNLDRMGTYP